MMGIIAEPWIGIEITTRLAAGYPTATRSGAEPVKIRPAVPAEVYQTVESCGPTIDEHGRPSLGGILAVIESRGSFQVSAETRALLNAAVQCKNQSVGDVKQWAERLIQDTIDADD